MDQKCMATRHSGAEGTGRILGPMVGKFPLSVPQGGICCVALPVPARDFMDRKMKYMKENIDKVQAAVGQKNQQLNAVVEEMQRKVQQQRQQRPAEGAAARRRGESGAL